MILEPSETDWQNVCAVSILSKNILMTAAHCIRSHESKRKVLLGQSVLDSETFESTRQLLNIAKVEQHPEYDNETAYFDIGLIFTSEEIEYNDAVQPICLPTTPSQNSDDLHGNLALLAGWGQESFNVNREKVTLRRTPLAIFSQEQCHHKYDIRGSGDDAKARARFLPDMFTSQTICAGSSVSLCAFLTFKLRPCKNSVADFPFPVSSFVFVELNMI